MSPVSTSTPSLNQNSVQSHPSSGGSAVAGSGPGPTLAEIVAAKYDCIIETGTSLVSTAQSRILQSFVTKHGNEVVADLIAKKGIGQLSKLPRGNLCLKVKSEEARRRLEGQEVDILGHTYKFREHDLLEDRFYVDVAGVNGDTNVDQLFMRLFDIGAKPLYATNREGLVKYT